MLVFVKQHTDMKGLQTSYLTGIINRESNLSLTLTFNDT